MYRKPREEHKNCEKYNGLWVDVTCNLYLEKEFTIGEPEGKIPLGTPRRRREHNDQLSNSYLPKRNSAAWAWLI